MAWGCLALRFWKKCNFNYSILGMYIVHYGELALKKGNRKFFEKKLVNNIQLKLSRVCDAKVKKKYGKYVIDSDDVHIWDILKKTPGISYFAKAEKVGLDMEEIGNKVVSMIPSSAQTK